MWEGEKSAGIFEKKKKKKKVSTLTLIKVILTLYLLHILAVCSWIVYYVKGINTKTKLMAWQWLRGQRCFLPSLGSEFDP